MVVYVACRVPNDPRGEWASGVQVGRILYPSRHFRTEREAKDDARALNAALRKGGAVAETFEAALATLVKD
jgi:hypothetical protein